MSRSLVAQAPADQRWVRVEDPSAAAACRGTALSLATRLGFPEARIGQLALAVTEAASNLHKHASQGSMLLRIARGAGSPGIEMVTVDAGPGFPDPDAALRDGHSTAGTLGIGLGAIRRLADFCDVYSVPGHGTALVARFWPAARADTAPYAGIVRPITGETECGDSFGAVEADGLLTGVLCDGLGHGPLAATAATEAVSAVLEDPADDPAVLLQRAHRRMAHTRGGALAVAQVAGPTVRFAGLGNVTAVILAGGTRKNMPSIPGIAGHHARAIKQFEYTTPPDAAIVMHSDGLSGRWQPAALPGLTTRDPLVVAATLFAQAGSRRDDAGVLVLKP